MSNNQFSEYHIDRNVAKDAYALQMLDIHKSFNNGQIKANVGINLSVLKNEVHAIIGENGAGKSTLMSILFGLYEPDRGEIFIRGEKVVFASSKDAAKYNIGMVHQHFKLIDNYSVIDNIILGSEKTVFGLMTRAESRKKIQAIIDQYQFNVDLSAKVSTLTVGQQQKVEILKVLFRNPDILIFDEPTAVLSDSEISGFLDILKLFKKEGKTIIIITHKLYEVKEVADVATVIRKGVYVDTVDVKRAPVSAMAELMVGHKLVESINDLKNEYDDVILEVDKLDLTFVPPIDWYVSLAEKKVRHYFDEAKKFLSFKKLHSKNKSETTLQNKNASVVPKSARTAKAEPVTVSFKVKKGEIFAIAGVEGNGQSKLAEYLSGLKLAKPKTIFFYGKDISRDSINKRTKDGISHVPEDRHKYGLVLDQSCRRNAVNNLINHHPFSIGGVIVEYEIAKYANEIIEKFDVRGTANGTANSRALSGGNQQKLIVGREITKPHKLLIMVQPTRGLDIGAIEYIHQRALEEKKQGNTIILISYELDEILALADTIAVMSRNTIVGMGNKEVMTRKRIGELLAGEEVKHVEV
ncbi:ABC transporter ATP-binding protein [[Mycoplasma] testudinis]|uniref:ABC transporter ATP-binding protein n=1 Tax=[Mycoplasma] testudinis TaxID=33924 RepID=UPI00069608D1|nr:ABC transporter ATP-binding protein [[Mycoplasma] testudinis]